MTAQTLAAPVRTEKVMGPVPRWAEWAAQATMWTALPSGIWRILFGLGLPAGFVDAEGLGSGPWWGLPYVIALTALAEILAFLSIGLVRPWGEVAPRWIPFIGGRPIRPLAAIIPASLGALALMLLWTPMILGGWSAGDDPEMPHGAKAVILFVCYAPLVLWGPLLAAVTVAYATRRRRHG